MIEPTRSPNRRGESRFYFKDVSWWKFRLNGRGIPTQWIHDLSQHGMQVRFRKCHCFEVGQVIPLEIIHNGKSLFIIRAIVRWHRDCEFSMNMVHLGLEFVDPQHCVARSWHADGLAQELQVDEPALHREIDLIHSPEQEEEIPLDQLSAGAALLAASLSFLIGYVAALSSVLFENSNWTSPIQWLFAQAF
ncbi:MAG: PilZ domain-containing protein [Bdellovibrionales bacterium]|nr:PilZ domain-containing protein [Bdellovibrionales bacterium]